MHIPPFSTTNSATRSVEELLYQLQVYQIELEMQNENLRQSYDALAELEQEYLELYEFAPVGYLILSNQGLIEKSNLTAATLLGESRSQLLQRRFAGFINTTDMDRWYLFFAHVMRGNQQKTIEIALKQPNDNWLHAKLHCRPVLKAGKQPTLWIALTDITESKQAAAELGIANIELTFQNKEKENRAAELGIANIELAFQNTEKEKRAAELSIANVELTFQNEEKEKRAAELVIVNQKLCDSETFASAVFDSVSAHTVVLNEEGIIIAVNHAWRQFADSNGLAQSYNYGIGGCYFQQNQKVFNELDGTINISYIIMAVINGSRDSFFWEYPCHSLTEQHWFCMRVLPLKGEKGSVVISHEDITERKKIQNKLTESERHLRAILDTTSECVKLIARDGTLLSINSSGLAMIEADSEDEVRNQCVYTPLAPEYRDAFQTFNEAVCDGKSGKMEFEMFSLKGTRHWMETHAVPFRLENGETVQLAVTQEITQRKNAEMELRIAATIFESHTVGMMITDEKTHILKVNQAFTNLTGYSEAELLNQKPRLLHSGRQDRLFYDNLWQSIRDSGGWQGEIWNKRKNGDIYPELLTITAVRANQDQITDYVATHVDITERKAAEEEIRQLAFYDQLTGLPNRRKLLDRLHYSIAINHRANSQFAVFMMDLDKFKAVNDKLGHAAGDELLKQVAARITNCLRESDMVARLGGDEFVLVLENLKIPEAAETVALKIIAELTLPFQLSETDSVQIGASIGISIYPLHGNTPESLMDHADTALYQAKNNGRGCFAYFS